MVEAPVIERSDVARRGAIAIFGVLAATLLGVVVAIATSTEAGGAVGVVGGIAALVVALRPLPVLDYLRGLDSLPAAAIALYLLGGLIPASTGIDVVRGISLDDVATLAATVLALAWLITNRIASVPRLALPLIALVGWLLVTWLIVQPSLRALLVGPGRWAIYAVMVVAATSWLRQSALRWWFVGVVLSVAGGQALIAIWAYHAEWLIDGFYVGIERFRWYEPLFDDVAGRTTGLLGISSNFFGAYTLIPAFLSLGVAVRSRSSWFTAAMVSAFGVFAYAGILSYTRVTLIALILGLAGFLVFSRPYRLGAVVLTVVIIAVISTPIVSRFSEGNDRAALAGQASETIFDNPFAGVGSGAYLGEDEGADGARTVTPHNSFLLQTSESGVVGGLLLVVAAGAALLATWGGSIPRRDGPGLMATAAFAGLGAVLVQTMSNNLLHIPPVATQFWLTAAAGACWALTADGKWSARLLAAFPDRSPS